MVRHIDLIELRDRSESLDWRATPNHARVARQISWYLKNTGSRLSLRRLHQDHFSDLSWGKFWKITKQLEVIEIIKPKKRARMMGRSTDNRSQYTYDESFYQAPTSAYVLVPFDLIVLTGSSERAQLLRTVLFKTRIAKSNGREWMASHRSKTKASEWLNTHALIYQPLDKRNRARGVYRYLKEFEQEGLIEVNLDASGYQIRADIDQVYRRLKKRGIDEGTPYPPKRALGRFDGDTPEMIDPNDIDDGTALLDFIEQRILSLWGEDMLDVAWSREANEKRLNEMNKTLQYKGGLGHAQNRIHAFLTKMSRSDTPLLWLKNQGRNDLNNLFFSDDIFGVKKPSERVSVMKRGEWQGPTNEPEFADKFDFADDFPIEMNPGNYPGEIEAPAAE